MLGHVRRSETVSSRGGLAASSQQCATSQPGFRMTMNDDPVRRDEGWELVERGKGACSWRIYFMASKSITRSKQNFVEYR